MNGLLSSPLISEIFTKRTRKPLQMKISRPIKGISNSTNETRSSERRLEQPLAHPCVPLWVWNAFLTSNASNGALLCKKELVWLSRIHFMGRFQLNLKFYQEIFEMRADDNKPSIPVANKVYPYDLRCLVSRKQLSNGGKMVWSTRKRFSFVIYLGNTNWDHLAYFMPFDASHWVLLPETEQPGSRELWEAFSDEFQPPNR